MVQHLGLRLTARTQTEGLHKPAGDVNEMGMSKIPLPCNPDLGM